MEKLNEVNETVTNEVETALGTATISAPSAKPNKKEKRIAKRTAKANLATPELFAAAASLFATPVSSSTVRGRRKAEGDADGRIAKYSARTNLDLVGISIKANYLVRFLVEADRAARVGSKSNERKNRFYGPVGSEITVAEAIKRGAISYDIAFDGGLRGFIDVIDPISGVNLSAKFREENRENRVS